MPRKRNPLVYVVTWKNNDLEEWLPRRKGVN